jgi:hypothetical protein
MLECCVVFDRYCCKECFYRPVCVLIRISIRFGLHPGVK